MSEKKERLEKLGAKKKLNPIARCLKSKDTNVRVDALHALGTCGTEDAINLLTNWANSTVKEERIAAYEAVGRCGKGYSITMMRHDLETEQDPDVIEAIKASMRNIQSRLKGAE